MKTKRSKLLITLISVATIGLSSAALQAQGDQQQMRHGDMWGRSLEALDISGDLKIMINEFRAKRAELMAQYREIHLQFREEVAPLIAELRALDEGSETYEADREALLAQMKTLRETQREAFGTEFRDARLQLREMKRSLREQIRDERKIDEG